MKSARSGSAVLVVVAALVILLVAAALVFPVFAHAKGGSRHSPAAERRYLQLLNRADRAFKDWKQNKAPWPDAASELRAVYFETHRSDVIGYSLERLLASEGQVPEAKVVLGRILHPDGTHGSTLATSKPLMAEYAILCKEDHDAAESDKFFHKSGALDWYDCYELAAENAMAREDFRLEVRYREGAAKARPDSKVAKRFLEDARAHLMHQQRVLAANLKRATAS